MFFVGITGQLITLMLSVCLPIVFLVSSHSKSALPGKTVQIEIQKNLNSSNSVKISSVKIEVNFALHIQNIKFEIAEIFNRKIQLQEFNLKWQLLYAESPENKAPPVIRFYSC
jgi:hypothetical protein